MRLLVIASILVLLLPVTSAFAGTSDGTSFMERAMRAGDRCDARWSRIAGDTGSNVSGLPIAGRRSGGVETRRSTARRRTPAGHSIDASGFIHGGTTNRFFPLTARRRGGATRGTSVLRNPAGGSHGLSHDRLRKPSARLGNRRGFFSRRLSAPRKSAAMGQRIGGVGRSRRSASRPAYRAARPRSSRR